MKYKDILNTSIIEHNFSKKVDIDISSHSDLPHLPDDDITSASEKLEFLPLEKVKHFYALFHLDIVKSFALHILILFLFFISDFAFLNIKKPDVMEVTFGLTSDMGNVVQDVQKPLPDGQTDATKTKEDLPKLPKHVVPDVGLKSHSIAQEKPKKIEKKSDLEFKEKTKQKEHKVAVEKAKVEGPKQQITKQKIEQKDFLKRKEEDLRKVAEKKEQGIHNRDKTKPIGSKRILTDVPKSPFQTSESIPNAPKSLTPTGAENGLDVSIYNSYRVYLQNQLKINWNTTEGSTYPADLTATINFTINQFGYLIGEPKIIKKSGNGDFDALVMSSLKGTFPISNPPPKEIHPPKTFNAIYTAKDIK